MANLSLKQEVRYVPNVPGNRALPEAEQISFSVTAGLTTIELSAFNKNVLAASSMPQPEGATTEQADQYIAELNTALAAVLESVVKVNPTATTIEGVSVSTVLEYLGALGQRPGGWLLTGELINEVRRVNSLGGQRELFSGRSSGGTTSTG